MTGTKRLWEEGPRKETFRRSVAPFPAVVVVTHLNRKKEPPPRKSPATCVYFNPSWGSYRDKHSEEGGK